VSRHKPARLRNAGTIRAKVTPEEHMALWWLAREKHGLTLDQFVRTAVCQYLERCCGTTLEKAVDDCRNKGRLVQMELF
jgi:hypothetical protein